MSFYGPFAFYYFCQLSDDKFKMMITSFEEKYIVFIIGFMHKYWKAPLKSYAASKMSKNAFFSTLPTNISKLGGDRHIWKTDFESGSLKLIKKCKEVKTAECL